MSFLEAVFSNVFLAAGIRVIVGLVVVLLAVILIVWAERKIVADMQNRIGPNRAGPWGILQTVADGLKLLMKERVFPRKVRLGVYLAAPVAALIPALLIFVVIPIGRPFHIGETLVTFQVTDLNVALLFVLAMSSLAVYAVVLAGWSSGSKYPLLGAVRATAQMISYEVAMGLALVPVVLFASSQAGDFPGLGVMSLSRLVELQQGSFRGFIPGWFVFWLSPSFVLFLIAGVAETNRPPFDLVEAESELVGGYHTEYSGFRFALFYLAEYLNLFNTAAISVTLFFGGWLGPDFGLPVWIAWVMPIFWFLLKTFIMIFVFIWIRGTLPRLRYDQLMTLGWKRLVPASLAWLVVFTLFIAYRQFGVPWL